MILILKSRYFFSIVENFIGNIFSIFGELKFLGCLEETIQILKLFKKIFENLNESFEVFSDFLLQN